MKEVITINKSFLESSVERYPCIFQFWDQMCKHNKYMLNEWNLIAWPSFISYSKKGHFVSAVSFESTHARDDWGLWQLYSLKELYVLSAFVHYPIWNCSPNLPYMSLSWAKFPLTLVRAPFTSRYVRSRSSGPWQSENTLVVWINFLVLFLILLHIYVGLSSLGFLLLFSYDLFFCPTSPRGSKWVLLYRSAPRGILHKVSPRSHRTQSHSLTTPRQLWASLFFHLSCHSALGYFLITSWLGHQCFLWPFLRTDRITEIFNH